MAYYVGMNSKQYTIRNVPPTLDRVLRKRAKLTGKSLNQVVLNDLAAHNQIPADGVTRSMGEMLNWFIGRGVDAETLTALKKEDRFQKRLMAKEWRK